MAVVVKWHRIGFMTMETADRLLGELLASARTGRKRRAVVTPTAAPEACEPEAVLPGAEAEAALEPEPAPEAAYEPEPEIEIREAPPQMTALQCVTFHGDQVSTVKDTQTGRVYCSPREICENMGLGWGAQYIKLTSAEFYLPHVGLNLAKLKNSAK
jgi:hypothetical protein